MKTYKVCVERTDTWFGSVRVVAESAGEATARIDEQLDKGWSEIFGDDDGDLVDSESVVKAVEVDE